MDVFDIDRHAIIARVKAGSGTEAEPEGSHVHVEIGDLLQGLREYVRQEADKARAEQTVQVPVVQPADTSDLEARIQALESRDTAPDNHLLSEAINRLDKLEQRPPMVPVANDDQAVPRAIGDLKSEIDELRKIITNIDKSLPQFTDSIVTRIETLENTAPTEPAELHEDLTNLANALLNHTNVLRKRIDACEARFSELPHVLAQVQAERRRL